MTTHLQKKLDAKYAEILNGELRSLTKIKRDQANLEGEVNFDKFMLRYLRLLKVKQSKEKGTLRPL